MRKTAFCLLILAWGTSASAQFFAPDHLEYYGYALIDCLYDDPLDDEVKLNYLDEVDNHTNIAQLCAFFPDDDIVERVVAMNEVCVDPLLYIQSLFYGSVPNEDNGGGVDFFLLEDWQERWASFAAINESVLNADQIGAFYYCDEPAWNGATLAETQPVVSFLKNLYPNIPIVHIEAGDGIDGLEIPVGIDWVGFNRYGTLTPTSDPIFQSIYNQMKAQMTAEQRVVLIAEAQWLPFYSDFDVEPEDMAGVLLDYYQLATIDTTVIGMLNYLWPGGFDAEGHLGMRQLPLEAQNLDQNIGQAIRFNQVDCLPESVGELSQDTPHIWQEGSLLIAQLPQEGMLEVYDVQGRLLVAERKPAGKQGLVLDAATQAMVVLFRTSDGMVSQRIFWTKP